MLSEYFATPSFLCKGGRLVRLNAGQFVSRDVGSPLLHGKMNHHEQSSRVFLFYFYRRLRSKDLRS
jgi:hypothetical protein